MPYILNSLRAIGMELDARYGVRHAVEGQINRRKGYHEGKKTLSCYKNSWETTGVKRSPLPLPPPKQMILYSDSKTSGWHTLSLRLISQ